MTPPTDPETSPETPRQVPGWVVAALLAVVVVAAAAALATVALDTRARAPLPSSASSPWPADGQPVDTALARAGRTVFQRACAACHTVGGSVGPDLAGLLERREPDWIRGMVLEPDSMLRADPVARALLDAYGLPMPDTGIGERELRAIVEHLRAEDRAGASP